MPIAEGAGRNSDAVLSCGAAHRRTLVRRARARRAVVHCRALSCRTIVRRAFVSGAHCRGHAILGRRDAFVSRTDFLGGAGLARLHRLRQMPIALRPGAETRQGHAIKIKFEVFHDEPLLSKDYRTESRVQAANDAAGSFHNANACLRTDCPPPVDGMIASPTRHAGVSKSAVAARRTRSRIELSGSRRSTRTGAPGV